MKKKDTKPRDSQAFETACKLFAQGVTKKQIAQTLDVSPNTITNWSGTKEWVHRVTEYKKIQPPEDQPKTRNEKKFRQACQLKAEEFEDIEIAALVGVTVTTIQRWSTDKKWKTRWQNTVNTYKANKQSPRRSEDEKAIDKITQEFISTLGLRDLKTLCIDIKRDIQYQKEIQKAAERALGDSEILQKLEDFCYQRHQRNPNNADQDISATQLRNQWSERLKPTNKPD